MCAQSFAKDFVSANRVSHAMQVRFDCGCLMDLLCKVWKSKVSSFLSSVHSTNQPRNTQPVENLDSRRCNRQKTCVCGCVAHMNVRSMHFAYIFIVWCTMKSRQDFISNAIHIFYQIFKRSTSFNYLPNTLAFYLMQLQFLLIPFGANQTERDILCKIFSRWKTLKVIITWYASGIINTG